MAAICVAPPWRAAIVLAGGGEVQRSVLAPACMDALGTGALLAWVLRRRTLERGVIFALIFGGGAMVIASLGTARTLATPVPYIMGYTLSIGIFTCGLLAAFRRWPSHAAFSLLRWTPIAYLGRISYGLYLYHGFVSAAVSHAFPGLDHNTAGLIKFPLTLGAAALSWHFVEAPINRLKRHFPYRAQAVAKPPELGSAEAERSGEEPLPVRR